MATPADSMERTVDGPLSAEQWQALGRLADRYQRVEDAGGFVARQFGGALTERTLELAELVQDPNFARTLRELNQTLTVLAETGLLARLREFLSFAAESETYLDTDRLIGELTKNAGKLPLAQISAILRGDETVSARKLPVGGWSGLLHVLRDAEVQRGLVVLGRFFDRLHTTEESK